MNKKVLMIFKAKQKIKKMKKEHPEMTEEEISEKVIDEMFGREGVELLNQVKKDPSKYAEALKEIHI